MSLIKRYKIIACNVFRTEYERLQSTLPSNIEYHISWFELGLHRNPDHLHALISKKIAETDSSDTQWDAILLLYGLCSRSILGLSSARHTLVVARAHDCITLFLGSKERYREEFEHTPGTYWFTRAFLNDVEPGFSATHDGIFMEYEKKYETYLERFGDPIHARYIIDHQEQSWIQNYTRGVFVSSGLDDEDDLREKARTYCRLRGWEFEEVTGDSSLMYDLLSGTWDEDRFLIVPKGRSIISGREEEIITSEAQTIAAKYF